MEERAWIVTISWGAGGRDLDLFTTVSSGGQTTSGIGWNNGSQTSVIQVNSGGINGTFYAKWGGDDTGWAGHETITVYFRGTLPSGHTQIAIVTPHCNYYGEGSGPATVVVDGQPGSYEVASPSTRYRSRAEASDPYVDVPLYADGGTPTPFPNLVTVSLDPSGGSVSPGALYYIDPTSSTKYGTLPTPTNSNASVFLGWFTAASGGTQVTEDSALVSTSSHTLYAQWKYQVYVWRWAPSTPPGAYVELDEVRDSGGLYPHVSKDYLFGQTANLFAYNINPLYRFKGWYRVDPGDPTSGGTLIGTNVRLSLVVSSNLKIRGDFEFIGLHLKVSAVYATKVTVSVNGQYDPSRTWEYYADVLIDSTVTFDASVHASNVNYVRFVRWEDENGNVLSTDNQHSFTTSGQADDWQYYYAYYDTCSNIKSSVSLDGGGTITYSRPADSPPDDPGDHWYVDGSSVSLTATPAAHYQFAYWEWVSHGITYRDYNAIHTINSVSTNIDFVAHFELIGMGQLIYDDTTGRLICADATGQLIYHDKMIELPASS